MVVGEVINCKENTAVLEATLGHVTLHVLQISLEQNQD